MVRTYLVLISNTISYRMIYASRLYPLRYRPMFPKRSVLRLTQIRFVNSDATTPQNNLQEQFAVHHSRKRRILAVMYDPSTPLKMNQSTGAAARTRALAKTTICAISVAVPKAMSCILLVAYVVSHAARRWTMWRILGFVEVADRHSEEHGSGGKCHSYSAHLL